MIEGTFAYAAPMPEEPAQPILILTPTVESRLAGVEARLAGLEAQLNRIEQMLAVLRPTTLDSMTEKVRRRVRDAIDKAGTIEGEMIPVYGMVTPADKVPGK